MIKRLSKFILFLLVSIGLYSTLLGSANAANGIQPWNSEISLPYEIASHTSFSTQNKLYVVSGSKEFGQARFNVLHADINSSGTLYNWVNSTTAFPTALIWHSTAIKNNYIYVLAGKEENFSLSMSFTNKVYRGILDSNSLISNWSPITSLPKALALGEALVINNFLYYAGGSEPDGTRNQLVYKALINPDGSLGPWELAGSLPYPLDGMGMVNDGNTLFIFGGNSTSGAKNEVWKSGVNLDGTLQVWTPLTPLPTPIVRGSIGKVGKLIVVAGGATPLGLTDKVFTAELDNDNNIISWQESPNHLPHVNCCSPLSVWNDHIYVTGGHDGVGYFSDVLSSKVSTASEEVTFSDVIDSVNTAEATGKIHPRTAALLRVTIKNAEKDYQAGKIAHAVKKIDQFKEIIVRYKKEANNPVLDSLVEDVETLKVFIQNNT